jgi:HD-GYP domain-containing protein (c-di-GMP phosphodiesterase class II)
MVVQDPVSPGAKLQADFRGMLPLALGTLAPAEKLDFDVFIRSDVGRAVLFRGRNCPLDQHDIRRLSESSIVTLYIRVAEHEEYCNYLRQVVLDNADLPSERRLQVLAAVNRSVFETAFSSPNVNRYVQFAEKFGKDLANVFCSDDFALRDLSRLLSHDYYTYTHVANVTTYCLALASQLGGFDAELLRQIAIGALLHDYGKRLIPTSVLNCTTPLTDEQWQIIQRHPMDGFREFCTRSDVNRGQLMMIYQHHERIDGKGYPVGVGGSDIHEWARMCKIADVFDALTSDRPYRQADSPSKVLEFMETMVGTEIDEEMFRCFQATINCSD